MRAPTLPAPPPLVVAGLLAGLVVLGFALRMDDPLSSPALGAEDPFTHVVFTKEALERGYFDDSHYLGTSLYPPGIHAFAGAVAPMAGVSLYDFARFAPPVLGALAVVGMFLLANRLGGPIAGLAAALATAVMPEHVFRTNLFFPTAFDLALLPAWLLAFDVALRGEPGDAREPWRSPTRAGAGALFLLMAVPLAFLHPWAVPLFAAPLAVYAALRALRSTQDAPRERVARELGFAAALLVVASAFAMASRWTQSDTGFADFFAHLAPLAWLAKLALPAPILFVVLLAVFGALAAAAVAAVAHVAPAARAAGARLPRWSGLALGVALLALLPFLLRDLPEDVHYLNMLGFAPLVLALGGFVVAFARPSRLGDLALALALVLFPLTALDLFGSPFWPQRTVAYLAIGVALLVGVAAAEIHVRMTSVAARRGFAAPAAVAASLAIVGGAVAAAPGDTYEWYRLYPDAQFAGFEETAALLGEDVEDTRVVVHSWQPALVLKVLAEPSQVRYAPDFFVDAGKRDKVLGESDDRTFVVVDQFLLESAKKGKADLGFLDDGGFRLVLEADDGAFRLYEVTSS